MYSIITVISVKSRLSVDACFLWTICQKLHFTDAGCVDSQGESHPLLGVWNDAITKEKWYCREQGGKAVNYLLGKLPNK